MFKEMKGEEEKQLSLQCTYKEKKNTKKYKTLFGGGEGGVQFFADSRFSLLISELNRRENLGISTHL